MPLAFLVKILYLKTPIGLQVSQLLFHFFLCYFQILPTLLLCSSISKYPLWTAAMSEFPVLENFPASSQKNEERIFIRAIFQLPPQRAVPGALSTLIYAAKKSKVKLSFNFWIVAKFTKWTPAQEGILLLQQTFSPEHPQSCRSSHLGLSCPSSTHASIFQKPP